MKPITIDEMNNVIIITKKFAEKASDPRTKECTGISKSTLIRAK